MSAQQQLEEPEEPEQPELLEEPQVQLLPQVQPVQPQEQALPELPEPEQPQEQLGRLQEQELLVVQLEQEQHMGCSSLSHGIGTSPSAPILCAGGRRGAA